MMYWQVFSKRILFCVFVLFVVCSGGCASHEGLYPVAPALTEGTAPEMNTPGYWTGLLDDPDEIIIPAAGIAPFNEAVRKETGKIKDIAHYPATYKGQWLRETFAAGLQSHAARRYFTLDGKRVRADFFEEISARMNVEIVPEEVTVRFGCVVAYANQRILPTGSGLYSGKNNHNFDRLQNSALDIGTPLAILHESTDGKWLYADSPLSAGWVRAEDVGLCSREQLLHYTSAEPFVVTLRAKTDIFLDENLRKHHAYVRMGTRFVCRPSGGAQGVVEILIPRRVPDGTCLFTSGFVAVRDIHPGYLPYTRRNVITQAFQLLNAPYGWGGMFGEQDCSRFVQEIFATVGIQFPRNSSQQARVGRLVGSFDEGTSEQARLQTIVRDAQAGISLLQMNGHIMLYLGLVDGRPYAIHDMWGYAEHDRGRQRLRVVNRVVVTHVLLGSGSNSGSLLERLITIRVVDAE